MVQGSASANRWPSADAVEDLLPNRRFANGNGSFLSLSATVVVGDIVRSEAGRAFRLGRGSGGDEVAFDDPAADWRSVYLTVRTEEILGRGERGLAGEMRVGVTLRGGRVETAALLDSFAGLGRSIFFVQGGDRRVDDTKDVRWLAYEGASTMRIEPGGHLSLPLYKADLSQLVPAEPDVHAEPTAVPLDVTFKQLRALAEEPDRVVDR